MTLFNVKTQTPEKIVEDALHNFQVAAAGLANAQAKLEVQVEDSKKRLQEESVRLSEAQGQQARLARISGKLKDFLS